MFINSIRSITAFLTILAIAPITDAAQTMFSELWGKNGEKWSPTSRLPDFSYAGYERGEKPLPETALGISVLKFGAKGDGKTDDTEAFIKALAETKTGAIEIPEGRYRITKPLVINKSGIVLRGAGSAKSVLLFPTPLNDITPSWGATTTGQKTSNYSWSGGFISINGNFGSKQITNVTASAKRGSKILEVASSSALHVGQEIEVFQSDQNDDSLAIQLYSGDPGKTENIRHKSRTSLISRITGIDGNRIALERPLRCDIDPKWQAQIRAFNPTVTGSGIEGLGFEFPLTPYKGHFTELGFNPIALGNVANCWIRNIRILNADCGPFIGGAFNTASNIVIESKRPVDSQGCTGHHGISLSGGDNLLTSFEIRTRFIHDITVSSCCAGNVASHGKAVDLSLDHHRRSPYENLFTDLDAGAGTRLWKCGGGAALGKNCGARGTFWNIRSKKPLQYPPSDFGPPSMNFVALESKQASVTQADGKWFESISPAQIQPADLHVAQRILSLPKRSPQKVQTP